MITYNGLKKIMKERNISYVDLAQMINMKDKTLRILMNGGCVSMGTLNKMCIVLNCQPADLIEYSVGTHYLEKQKGGDDYDNL